MKPLNIAHRGGAALMPENTLAAFADAVARGCDGAEMDVQLSRDGVVVVHHDFRLMADVARKDGAWLKKAGPRIKDLTWAELQQFDVGSPRPGSSYAQKHPLMCSVQDAKVPALEEVVALAANAPHPFLLMVELKTDTSPDSADPAALAAAVYKLCAGLGDRVIFVGFDWRALLPLAALGAPCWFTTDRLEGDVRPVIDAIAEAGGQGWFPNFPDATPDSMAYVRTKGLKAGAWTVNEPADMARLKDLDALCTDRPDLLADLA